MPTKYPATATATNIFTFFIPKLSFALDKFIPDQRPENRDLQAHMLTDAGAKP